MGHPRHPALPFAFWFGLQSFLLEQKELYSYNNINGWSKLPTAHWPEIVHSVFRRRPAWVLAVEAEGTVKHLRGLDVLVVLGH